MTFIDDHEPRMTPRKELAARAVLIAGSLLIGVGLLELGCRLHKGKRWLLEWPNFVVSTIAGALDEQNHWAIYDPLLGYTPRPNAITPYGAFDRRGFRLPSPLPDGAPSILATGGSLTMGDEVADGETWPAALQELTGTPVVNAGVSGYAFDQIVLRTEELAAALRPAAAIVSFTADNVWRTEMSRLWAVEKPYFLQGSDGRLVMRNVPVPREPVRPTVLQRLFGWSLLVETVLRRIEPDESWMEWRNAWLNGSVRAMPSGEGEAVACALMERLAVLGIPILVVGQYESTAWTHGEMHLAEERRQIVKMLSCAAAAGLAALDTFELVGQAVRRDGLRAIYLDSHHTPSGNLLVAQSIASTMSVLNRTGRPASRVGRDPEWRTY